MHPVRMRLALLLTPTLLLVLAAGTAQSSTLAAAPHGGSGSDEPSAAAGLALRNGARLAPPRILDIYSTPLALSSVVTDQGASEPSEGHSTQPPSALPSADTPGAAQPGTPSALPSANTPGTPSTTPASSAAQSSQPEPFGTGHPASGPALIGAGTLLAAAVTGALALHRIRRRRTVRRGPGQTATTPAPGQAPVAAAPDGVTLLDAALRTLAGHSPKARLDGWPPLRGAFIDAAAVHVLPADPASPPLAPFTAGDDGRWILPADAALPTAATSQAPAPYPALVTLGTTEDGELALVNLALLPALLLDGEPHQVAEVCTALTVEVAISPWAHDAEIITTGCAPDLARHLPATHLTQVADAAQALQETSERLLEAHQLPRASRQPLIVVCAGPLPADTARQFADLTTTRLRALTLIAPAPSTAPHFPHAPVLDASHHQPQHLEQIGARIRLQHLTPAAYQEIITTLHDSGTHTGPDNAAGSTRETELSGSSATAAAPPDGMPPGPSPTAAPAAPHQDVPGEDDGVFPALLTAARTAGTGTGPTAAAEPAPPAGGQDTGAATAAGRPPATSTGTVRAAKNHTPPAAGTDEGQIPSAPQIRVLGPVEVDGVDASGHGPRIAQLAALIYFKPGRTADTLCTDMDPTHPWSAATLNARLHGLRAALGNDPDGRPYVPRRKSGDDPYHLHPAITSDWTRFQHLTRHARSSESAAHIDVERLEAALALVRGTPFDGKALPWAEPLQQEITTAITAVVHAIAAHRTSPGPHHDLGKARQAIACGIDVDGTAEVLYRDWILVEDAAGNRQGVHTAISRVQHISRTLNCPLGKETEQLINSLLGPARHTQATRP
ncbi:hypothetical protein [Streptomyces sp. NPDC046909]|uniref:hypothetical protein n=1 Tax=Streptomyces sp. NPDC046909 TaxID=3155617 RepID=UPI0033E1BA50